MECLIDIQWFNTILAFDFFVHAWLVEKVESYMLKMWRIFREFILDLL